MTITPESFGKGGDKSIGIEIGRVLINTELLISGQIGPAIGDHMYFGSEKYKEEDRRAIAGQCIDILTSENLDRSTEEGKKAYETARQILRELKIEWVDD